VNGRRLISPTVSDDQEIRGRLHGAARTKVSDADVVEVAVEVAKLDRADPARHGSPSPARPTPGH
jgi:hypothetical protein